MRFGSPVASMSHRGITCSFVFSSGCLPQKTHVLATMPGYDFDARLRVGADTGDGIKELLAELAGSLQEARLDRDRLLPPKRPQFFPRSSAAALQQRIDAASKRLAVATLVFQRGWSAIIRDPQTDARQQA